MPQKFSPYDLVTELQTWVSFTDDELEALKKKPSNSLEFRKIMRGWQNGFYDESPEYVKTELLNLK